MKNNGIKRSKSPTLFLFILAIIWFCLYWFLMFPVHLLMFTWTQVSWIVTDVIVHEDDEDWDTYEPIVKYTCWWIIAEQRQWYGSSTYYHTWEEVTLYCNEKNPTKFAIKSFSNYLMLLFPLGWLVVLFFGFKILYEDIKRKKLKNKLLEYWLHIEAIISEIKNTGAKIGNVPWYQIIATHDWKVFKSETIYATVKYILREWDKIDIYVDPLNSNDYRMDTDSIFGRPIRNDYESTTVDKPNNQNISQDSLQNFVENNILGDTVPDPNKNNTAITTPRPPKMSDKKCPIRRVKIGYWYGIIFSLIWGLVIMIPIIDSIKNIWWTASIYDLLPSITTWGMFLVAWLIMLIPKVRRNKRKKRLMEWWVKKEGMITEILSNGVVVNNQRWYIISAIYNWKLYKSEPVYANIRYLVEKWDEIDIYVGTWWDEDYRVDVDNIFYRELKPSYYERPHSIWDVFNAIKKDFTTLKESFKRNKTE